MDSKKRNEMISLLLLSICVLIIASYIFIPEQLMNPIDLLFGIPIGNLITGIGFIAAASIAFYLPGSDNRFLIQKKILLVFAILWLPFSILLSGNVFIGFDRNSQTEMKIWLIYTIFTAASILILLVLLRVKRKT